MSGDKIKVSVDPDLEDLIPGFLENRANDCSKLEAAVADNDLATLQSLGHNLKGVGGGYGFETMSEIGAAIETAAKESNISGIPPLIQQLAEYLENIEVVYE